MGSGGREHALAWKLSQSPDCGALYVAPGNAGTTEYAQNLPIEVTDFENIGKACLHLRIDLLVVGPEVPLVAGVVDYFASDPSLRHINVVGPDSKAAQLEGSKDFAKSFMSRHGIPTAAYRTFRKGALEEGLAFLRTMEAPFVIKADGLAAGKGVLILDTLPEAEETLRDILEEDKFDEAGRQVVIEEFLEGIELSCFVWIKAGELLYLPFAKDYKRIGEGDTGLNTGGMGAVSPIPFMDEALRERIDTRIVQPTLRGLQTEGLDYNGFLFVGLMVVDGDPFVIEYNVRLGDPETEVILPRIQTDILPLLKRGRDQGFGGITRLEFDPRYACTVIAVSGGYPEAYAKGKKIEGLDRLPEEGLLFHAGTREENGHILTSGGRVLAATSFGHYMEQALSKSYETLQVIDFEGMYYRTDIGFDLR